MGIDPNRPQAYEIAGIAQLYGFKNPGEAATAMRAAVQRGGSASFSVTHDHDGFFQTYCQGSLYISRQGVSYRSFWIVNMIEAELTPEQIDALAAREDVARLANNPTVSLHQPAPELAVNDYYGLPPRVRAPGVGSRPGGFVAPGVGKVAAR